ncbi:hypothetical protein BJN34_22710 [Cupriavidus necator]|uniref:Transposase n=2 Tax=Cupriavidus necator TaxID=106590 RepID=A0A1U9UVU2_CUPNE|nr:hypothetical protein BJN34_22710 [Cupriavidus necator]
MVEDIKNAAFVKNRAQGKVVRVRTDRIPRRNTFIYHAKRLIAELGLDEKYPAPQVDTVGAKGGNAVDVTFGRVVGDIDTTHLSMVEVIYNDHEKGVVSGGNPLLAFLVERESGCIVSWKVSYGRAENSTLYRHLVLKAFLPKDKWLDDIGYTGDRSGFVHGKLDAVCPDRGPGYATNIREMFTEEMKIGVVSPPPRTPEGKPHVEGKFGNVKTMVRWVFKQLRDMNGGVISTTKPKGNGRKRKPGVVARLMRNILERLIAEAVNIVNTRRYRQSHVSRAMISPSYKGVSAADVFRHKQELRRGNAALPVDSANIYERFLEKNVGFIRAGKIRARNAEYSSDALRAFEVDYRGKNGLTKRKGIPVPYVIPPDSNSLLWVKPEGGVEVLRPTNVNEKHFGEDGAVDEQDIDFRNRIHAATDGEGRQRQPAQRNRLKKPVHDLIVEQLAAVGELPRVIPRDPVARAALREDEAREAFYAAVDGAGIDVPNLEDEPISVEPSEALEAAPEQPRRRRQERGAWYRSQIAGPDRS